MASGQRQGPSCVRSWFWGLFAGLAAGYVFYAVSEALEHIIGPNEAQLVVFSEAPIQDVQVVYDGLPVASRPDVLPGGRSQYFLFPGLRSGQFEPVLQVSWRGPSGLASISRPMRQFHPDRRCLYLLRLDQFGNVIELDPPDSLSPFWWRCSFS